MTGIEQRLERAKDIQVETIKLTKKTIKELCGANNDRKVSGGNASGKGENAEEVMYKGKDLTKMTGDTPEITTKNIATALFSPDELSKVVIDPQKTLPKTCRTPADEFRTSLYRKAVRGALGSQYSDALYRKTLRLVNQKGTDTKSYDRKKNITKYSDREEQRRWR